MNRTAHNRDIADWWVEYGPGLVRYARRRLNGVSVAGTDAEDIVQEAITSLLARPIEVENPRSLLYRIVFLKCAGHIRSTKAMRELTTDPASYRFVGSVTDDDREVRVIIHQALSGLTDRERTIAVQRLMNGHRVREVAEQVGLNYRTILKKLPGIIDALRIELDDLDEEERLPDDELSTRRLRLLEEMAAATSLRRACNAFGIPKSTYYLMRDRQRAAS